MSNLKYIRRFRQPHLESGSVSYFLTTLTSALSFICNCTLEDFTFANEAEKEDVKTRIQSFVQQQQQKTKQAPATGELTEMASSAYRNTSLFLGQVYKDLKSVGEAAAEKMESVLGNTSVTQQEHHPYPGRQQTEEEYELQVALAISLSLQESSASAASLPGAFPEVPLSKQEENK